MDEPSIRQGNMQSGRGVNIFIDYSHQIHYHISMSTTKVKCAECRTEFDKRTADYNWTERNKLRHFCSRSCSITKGNKEMSMERRQQNGDRIKIHSANRQDDYSAFKPYLSKWRNSMVKHKDQIDIDLKYLRELWDVQNGICPYTRIKMLLPRNTKEHMKLRSLKKASLDRIDSSKGYLKGNVEFVCCAINYAKNSFTREQMKEFLSEIGGPAGSCIPVSNNTNSQQLQV